MSAERRGPAVCTGTDNMGGKGEMTKAPSSLQDLRRSLYIKAKAEPSWRFWGLLRRRFHRVLARHGCRTTDHFAGFQITGRFRTVELVGLMSRSEEHTSELQ